MPIIMTYFLCPVQFSIAQLPPEIEVGACLDCQTKEELNSYERKLGGRWLDYVVGYSSGLHYERRSKDKFIHVTVYSYDLVEICNEKPKEVVHKWMPIEDYSITETHTKYGGTYACKYCPHELGGLRADTGALTLQDFIDKYHELQEQIIAYYGKPPKTTIDYDLDKFYGPYFKVEPARFWLESHWVDKIKLKGCMLKRTTNLEYYSYEEYGWRNSRSGMPHLKLTISWEEWEN